MDNLSSQQKREEPAGLISVNNNKFTFEQLTRLLLKLSSDFCAVPLFNDDDAAAARAAPERLATNASALATFKGEAAARRRPRWVIFVRGLYFYATTRVLIYICLQYMYDFDLHKYDSLQESSLELPVATENGSGNRSVNTANTIGSITATARTSTNTTDTNSNHYQLQLLGQRIERDTGRLKCVGAPFIKFHFGVELVYIYLVWFVFAVYFRPQLYFRFIRPFDVSLLRAVLNWELEQKHCEKLVKHEVNKFCLSNRFFVQSYLHWSCIRRSGFVSGIKAHQLLASLGRTAAQLNRMVVNGSLRPLNRSLVWIQRTSHSIGHFCFWNIVGQIVVNVSFLFYLPRSRLLGMTGIETTPMDLLSFVESLILSLIGVTSLNFYLTLTAFNTLDQINTVNELNKLIECCISSNTRTFWRIRAAVRKGKGASFSSPHNSSATVSPIETTSTPTTSAVASKTQFSGLATSPTSQQPKAKDDDDDDDDEYDHKRNTSVRKISQSYAQMNNNLLFVVMSYKIFVSQTKSTRSFHAYAMLTTAELMILGPVLTLAHAQYLTAGMFYSVVGCWSFFIILGDISLAPRCYFYSRHLRTYRALHSLVAHTVSVSRAVASTVDLYDSHTILLLRRELSEPSLLLKPFATTLLGIHFNYTNFLKIHFWCGILAILAHYAASGPNKRSTIFATITRLRVGREEAPAAEL